MLKFPGKRPTNLGVADGKLLACPSSPNCVSSQAPSGDAQHFIEALPLTDMARLRAVVEGMERTRVIEEQGSYLYAEFETPLMGFIDDVEFYCDTAAGITHVRSASRLGKSDLGLNRQRVEAIRAAL